MRAERKFEPLHQIRAVPGHSPAPNWNIDADILPINI